MRETKLKLLRKKYGFTQEESRSIGYECGYYGMVGQGHRNLSMAMIERICVVYKLPWNYFLEQPGANLDGQTVQLQKEIGEILEDCNEDALRQIAKIIKTFTEKNAPSERMGRSFQS